MGKIVAAMATVHAPQLFTRPPTEDPAQLDADIAAMRELGKTLDETKPDVVIVIGSDHLETFFLSAVPTFAIIAGKRCKASFAGRDYELPTHPLAEELLDKLVDAGFDMTYSQDAVLGHSFAAVYEWVIEGRSIPVVPLFVNTYLPPLPSARRCEALGKAIREIVENAAGARRHRRQRRHVALPRHLEVSAAGLRLRLVGHRANGARQSRRVARSDQRATRRSRQHRNAALDGAVRRHRQSARRTADLSADLAPRPRRDALHPQPVGAPSTPEPAATWKFEDAGGYQFYKHPDPAVYRLNKVIFDLRHSQELRRRLFAGHSGPRSRIWPDRQRNRGARPAERRKHRRPAFAEIASAGGSRRASAGNADGAGDCAGGTAKNGARGNASNGRTFKEPRRRSDRRGRRTGKSSGVASRQRRRDRRDPRPERRLRGGRPKSRHRAAKRTRSSAIARTKRRSPTP